MSEVPPQRPEHRAWIDVLRVLAALAVVVIHVSAAMTPPPAAFGSPGWWWCNFWCVAGAWCVNVFVMISGALLLAPSRVESAGEFYRRRARRLLVPIVFWVLAYVALRFVFDPTYSWQEALRNILHNGPYYHLWYFYVLIGLYLATPFLRTFLRAATPGEVLTVCALIIGVKMLSALVELGRWPGLSLPVDLTGFVAFFGIYLLGHYLGNMTRCPFSTRALVAILAGSVILGAIGTYILTSHFGAGNGNGLKANHAPTTVLSAVAVFVLARRFPPVAAGRRVWTWLAPLTLGVYVIHPIFILALRRVGLTPDVGSAFWTMPLAVLLVAAASLFATWVIAKIPGLRATI